jgi:hypothetical protein
MNPGNATTVLRALPVLTRQHTTRQQTTMTCTQPLSPAR